MSCDYCKTGTELPCLSCGSQKKPFQSDIAKTAKEAKLESDIAFLIEQLMEFRNACIEIVEQSHGDYGIGSADKQDIIDQIMSLPRWAI